MSTPDRDADARFFGIFCNHGDLDAPPMWLIRLVRGVDPNRGVVWGSMPGWEPERYIVNDRPLDRILTVSIAESADVRIVQRWRCQTPGCRTDLQVTQPKATRVVEAMFAAGLREVDAATFAKALRHA